MRGAATLQWKYEKNLVTTASQKILIEAELTTTNHCFHCTYYLAWIVSQLNLL